MASTRPLKKLLTGSKEWGTGWHDSPRLICCSAAVYARGHVGLWVAWSRVPASTTVPRNKPSQQALAPPDRGTCCHPRPCPWEQSPEDHSLGSPPHPCLEEEGKLTAPALKLLTTSKGTPKLYRHCDRGRPEVQGTKRARGQFSWGRRSWGMSKRGEQETISQRGSQRLWKLSWNADQGGVPTTVGACPVFCLDSTF